MGLSALVITPTTGAPELADAINSVLAQTYTDVEHLIVVDGSKFSKNTDDTLERSGIKIGDKVKRIDLPFNTGGNGYYGHRVMAGFSHLFNHDYVLFLDQDNWYEPDHVKSLIDDIKKYNFEWAYSLRKIYDKDRNFMMNDNCESLGRWPAWVADNAFLIDSSSYCFTNNFIRMVGHIWDFGWGADRRFYTIVKDQIGHNNYGCSNKFTLNYRLGGNDGSVTAEFFNEGNAKMIAKYGSEKNLPWQQQIT